MKTAPSQPVSDAIAAGFILAAGSVLAGSGHAIASRASTSNAEALLGLCASALGLIIVIWWVFTMAFAVLAALLHAAGRQRSARWAGAAAPPFMRRLALAVLGATLAVGPAAHADEPPLDPTWQATAPLEASAAAPLETPTVWREAPTVARDVPTATAAPPEHGAQPESWIPRTEPPSPGPLARPELRTSAHPPSAVEVRRGDSLWSIAARHLGSGADPVDVADMWPKWFEANRGVIGDDPNVLRPGQLLVPPDR